MVSPTACAAASESPIPLVKLDIVVPDIVPDIISSPILTCAVPDVGKFVADVNVNAVDVVVSAFVDNVVDIPEKQRDAVIARILSETHHWEVKDNDDK